MLNYHEVLPHPGQNGHHQNYLQTINAVESVEKREPSCTVGGNVNDTATMDNSMEAPEKAKHRLPYDPAIPLLGIYPENIS